MYPTQNVIRPITNSNEHTGMTTSVCDVRYVQSTSCPITCRTSCSVVFRINLWWISMICSPLPKTGFIAELWNRLYMTHKTPVNKEKAGSICHLMVYTNRVRIESVCGLVTGNKNIRGHRMQRWRQLQPSSHEPRTRGHPEKNASPPQTRGLSRSLYSSSIILELFHNSMYMYLCSCRRLCLALHTIFHTANF